jgi:hypothetical protein
MPTKAQLGQKLTDYCMEKDAEACAACYTDDAELASPLGTARGTAEIRQFFEGWFAAFEDYDIVDDLTEDGDTLHCDSVCKATHVGPMELPNGEVLPATGRRITINAHEVTLWEGDLIKRHTMEFDIDALIGELRAAGAPS